MVKLVRSNGVFHIVKNFTYDTKSGYIRNCETLCKHNINKKRKIYVSAQKELLCTECFNKYMKPVYTNDGMLEKIEYMSKKIEYMNKSMEYLKICEKINKLLLCNVRYHNPEIDVENGKVVHMGSPRRNDGKFDFIPNDMQEVYNFLKYIVSNFKILFPSKRSIKCLDVGCGVGNVILLANAISSDIFNKFDGIEINPVYADLARKIVTRNGYKDLGHTKRCFNNKIFEEDVLKFKKYKDYDIIYFYRPLEDLKKQLELEQLIEDEMKIGCVYLPFYKANAHLWKDKRFKVLKLNGYGEQIFVKVKKRQ